MKLYCAECGLPLQLVRKALPKYNTIIDVVLPHVCLEVPMEIDLKPINNKPLKEQGKFVSKLNDLNNQGPKGVFGGISTADLHDRRFDPGEPLTNQGPKSSIAPQTILNMIDSIGISQPAHDFEDPESEE